ncbi:MAG: helix-turn-helix domain-containing protein [Candidatus Competibacteraceae bacterium]|nr:helix-turn-helix domain-containing protein [Candidatus Competibacteraceae bacterium]
MSARNDKIAQGLGEALGARRGELELKRYRGSGPAPVDARALREGMGLTQEAFAETFGIPLANLRAWEQGLRRPNEQALLLLHLIRRHPKIVAEAARERRAGAEERRAVGH